MTCSPQIGDALQAVLEQCGPPVLTLTEAGVALVEKLVYGHEGALTIFFFLNRVLERINYG